MSAGFQSNVSVVSAYFLCATYSTLMQVGPPRSIFQGLVNVRQEQKYFLWIQLNSFTREAFSSRIGKFFVLDQSCAIL